MHTEQKIWSNWILRQQNYLTYPILPVLLWGPLFVGAPVRPHMLNMPKSASGTYSQAVEIFGNISTALGIVAIR